jgi:hypothetical protein
LKRPEVWKLPFERSSKFAPTQIPRKVQRRE